MPLTEPSLLSRGTLSCGWIYYPRKVGHPAKNQKPRERGLGEFSVPETRHACEAMLKPNFFRRVRHD
jgi:hypothetical protein